MINSSDYIAVFDSGVGGISVLRHLMNEMPNERYLYFGDSANAPYGNRSTEQVRELTLAAIDVLMRTYAIKAVVIACNTATSASVKQVRDRYPNHIIIGIEPALKVAADNFPGKQVGVMATDVTLREEKFDSLLHRFDDNCCIVKIPAPGLVQLIEKGKLNSQETKKLLYEILSPFSNKLDALVLGCTHYPFVSASISEILGERTTLIDGNGGTARETKRRLKDKNLLHNGTGELIILNSSNDKKILELSRKLLNKER